MFICLFPSQDEILTFPDDSEPLWKNVEIFKHVFLGMLQKPYSPVRQQADDMSTIGIVFCFNDSVTIAYLLSFNSS